MSKFFEQELRKLFGDGAVMDEPSYSGRACFGTLGKDLRVRAQFISTGIADHYDALRVTVLNRTDGPVDTLVLKLKDLLGKRPVPGNTNFRNGVFPYIWVDNGKADWYAYRPTITDYQKIKDAVGDYLDVFREREAVRKNDGPRLVYICAPLRSGEEKDIEFARQKAQEVFKTGAVPVCPHLMFPPISDLESPEHTQAVQEMGLRLAAACQQVNVYGSELTDVMLAEIQQATRLGIEVRTEQKSKRRSQPSR